MKRRNFLNNGFKAIIASFLLPFLEGENGEITAAQLPAYKPDPANWRADEINIAWIGHSTVLINFYGKFILTDPVFYERVGLYFLGLTFGPSRFTHPALALDEIPKPDLVLLSHAHMDHMDFASLRDLTSKYPNEIDCITAYNTKDVIEELKWKSLQEMDWKDQMEFQGFNFTAIEVRHFGWRFPWERDRSKNYFENGRSYNAYLIERNGKKILFGGDTAMSELFQPLKNENIDIAIMPIGAYQPWKKNHCNPEEALIMADHHLKAKYFVPIHTKTFKQGSEPILEPLNWLRESVVNYNIKLGLDDIGQTLTIRA